jgi:hypothetical protein
MLETGVSQACYFGVPIYSDESVNSMFRFARINEINMLELYLSSGPRRGHSSSRELAQFPSISHISIQASRAEDPSKLSDNHSRQVSVLEIVNMRPQLGMTSKFEVVNADEQYECND